jgi:pyridoxal phosphate enzyme (YggS family)
VNAVPRSLSDRLESVRGRIAEAARAAARPPGAVRLIGVVKTVPPGLVREAVAAGLEDLGESRVQEARGKIEAVGRSAARWHMVGHLQRNKAGAAVGLFDRIHSVDDVALAETLSRRALDAGFRMPVLVEVNVSGESSKHGVAPEDLMPLLEIVLALPGLAADGLMTVGAPVERVDDARPGFARLRELRDRAADALGAPLPELSMGMSDDFEAAVREGSTMVRIGTALFGARG